MYLSKFYALQLRRTHNSEREKEPSAIAARSRHKWTSGGRRMTMGLFVNPHGSRRNETERARHWVSVFGDLLLSSHGYSIRHRTAG